VSICITSKNLQQEKKKQTVPGMAVVTAALLMAVTQAEVPATMIRAAVKR
jgi:hypothetical protein